MSLIARLRPGHCLACEGWISGRPFVRAGDPYCCVGCADGGPCVCDYEADLASDGVDGLSLPFHPDATSPFGAPRRDPVLPSVPAREPTTVR